MLAPRSPLGDSDLVCLTTFSSQSSHQGSEARGKQDREGRTLVRAFTLRFRPPTKERRPASTMLKRGYALAAACLAAAVAVTAFTPNGKSRRHRLIGIRMQLRLGLRGGVKSISAHTIASNGPILHLRHILCHCHRLCLPVKLLGCN